MTAESTKSENTYPLDPESEAEMGRLLDQDLLLNRTMEGLFPEQLDLSNVHRVLDIACGPGGWALEVAFEYPDMEVVGVDISRLMIAYANMRAKTQGLDDKATFKIMDVTKPLDFPDSYFDFVNLRYLCLFMRKEAWPRLLAECMRITRLGGVIRLTEPECGFANTPAFEKYWGLFYQALTKSGQSFSPNGQNICLTPMLKRLLRDAGCQNIQRKAYVLDHSAGEEANQSVYQDLRVGFVLALPFIQKANVAPPEVAKALCEQGVQEMKSEEFCALWFILSVWGQKL
ncbi:MAG: class I SAM-dependent methyltransferase [Chloroflexi bacterium]|nr:class I SAM-dependent methyltransferase [Ktedonobacteraceae bacterium]MBV9021245.1 class I SAM-dependent methyltransferase [Ktedonobacteraceae bacterium]MBV9707953.1 class I SAM-dependent methyltransferase [Chloroflexota bacterium]